MLCGDGAVNGALWERLLAAIEERNHILASKLKHAEPSVKAGRLILAFNGGHSIHSDSVQKSLGDLKAVLREVGDPLLGAVEDIDVVQRSGRSSDNGRVVSLTPVEERVMEVFGGRIIDKRRTNV
ncbi:MAG TPA: hypothetical protein ENJ04_02055 [Nitrospirae bacterium]|nr:hypothetical protein [Nitrospirota bacterium]